MAKGIYFGFKKDWHSFLKCVVPEIEESIRFCLEKEGISTVLIQNENRKYMSLGSLMDNTEDTVKSIFGTDTFHVLKILLLSDREKNNAGYNLRNEVAHGRFSAEKYELATIKYLWALVINIYLGRNLVINTKSP